MKRTLMKLKRTTAASFLEGQFHLARSVKLGNGTTNNNFPKKSLLLRSFRTSAKQFSGPEKNPCDANLAQQLAQVIKTNGPISIAAYMRQCLTNPTQGYYTQRDPFGRDGDFVTSPEISQMFGELVGIWCVAEWMAMQEPKEVNLIELGPGKGTLLSDLLRAASKFPKFVKTIHEIHLLEASDKLREVQRAKICDQISFDRSNDQIWSAKSSYGPRVFWHADIATIPQDLSRPFVLAHEFFDAMPIHAFEMTENGWRELLVDIANAPALLPAGPSSTQDNAAEVNFHLTRSNKATPHSLTLTKAERYQNHTPPNRIEISPEAIGLVNKITSMISASNSSDSDGGVALIMDYGPADTIPIDTLRGISNHKIVSPFEKPGQVDLSVDVDFAGLAAESRKTQGIYTHGPVTQGDWLHALGIGARATVLAKNAKTEEGKKQIGKDYQRLTEAGAMGRSYKVMAITTNSRTPTAFS